MLKDHYYFGEDRGTQRRFFIGAPSRLTAGIIFVIYMEFLGKSVTQKLSSF